jgi:hypothetical protein
MFASQWYLNATQGINAPKAWTYTKGSPSVVVAVIDSGITKHPDLDSQLVAGYDFVSNNTRTCSYSNSGDGDGWDADPSDPGDYYTDNTGFNASSWHGTHVAGIIAAAQNDYGISGIAPGVKIQPSRALGPDGGCSADLIAALNWAAGLPVPNTPANKTPAKVRVGLNARLICSMLATAFSARSTPGCTKGYSRFTKLCFMTISSFQCSIWGSRQTSKRVVCLTMRRILGFTLVLFNFIFMMQFIHK